MSQPICSEVCFSFIYRFSVQPVISQLIKGHCLLLRMTRNENIYAQDSIFSVGAINRLFIFYLHLVGPYQGSGSPSAVQLQCLNERSMGWHPH